MIRTVRALLCAGILCAGLASSAQCAPGATAGRSGRATSEAPRLAGARFSDEASRVDRVLQLEDERLSLMPAVAAWKWQHRAAVSDPARERAVMLAAVKLGEPLGLSAEPLERLYELQMRLARNEESDLHRRWREGGYSFAGPVPSLGGELRPRLDRLTRDLLRALYLAAPRFARADFAARYAAHAARLLRSEGWSSASRRELLADLGAIRLLPRPALERIEAAHVLRIGTTGDYPPFSSESSGRLSGVEIELGRALARSLAAEPIFVQTSWPTLLEDMRRNEFDVAIGGISATPAREAAAAVSIPYFSGGKTIIAPCRDGSRFDSLGAVDRPGVRVIVNPGGTNEQYVRAHLRRARIIVYPSNVTIFDALLAGRADVMITDDVEAELQIHRHPGLCRPFAGTLTHGEKVMLMARDPALVAAVNGWLRGELAAGTPARLLREALAR